MFEINIVSVQAQEDHQHLEVQVSNEFKAWFVKKTGLKRWHHMKFRKVFLRALSEQGIVFKNARLKITVRG